MACTSPKWGSAVMGDIALQNVANATFEDDANATRRNALRHGPLALIPRADELGWLVAFQGSGDCLDMSAPLSLRVVLKHLLDAAPEALAVGQGEGGEGRSDLRL
jgi:hypothetical protein